MTILKMTSTEALETARENGAFRKYPTRDGDNRCEPIACPRVSPSFSISKGEKIATMGSCFARSIERILNSHGFDVLNYGIEDHPFIKNSTSGFETLNKYAPVAMLDELRWALDPDHAFPDSGGFLEIGPDKWIDLHTANPDARPLAEIRQQREVITSNYRKIIDCRVVILTLGLIEVWWDNETHTYVNWAPPIPYLKNNPDRFSFHVLDFDEVNSSLNHIYDLLCRFLPRDFRLILTVSPIPLQATYRDMDIITANAYSKSVLRASIDKLVQTHENIDYYPSYESITLSERHLAFGDDNVHPTMEIIQLNTQRMMQLYGENAALDSGKFDLLKQWIEGNFKGLSKNRLDIIIGEVEKELSKAVFKLEKKETEIASLKTALESQQTEMLNLKINHNAQLELQTNTISELKNMIIPET